MAFADSWIVVPVFAPLTAALFAFLVRRGSFFISLAAVCLNLLAAAVLVDQFLVNGPAAYAVGGWDPPLGICLRTDGPALIMLVLTAVAGVGVSHLRQSRRLCLCEPLKAVLFKKFSDHL
ncbi:MAG: hypothetical protein PHX57_10330, partial [Desulfobulbaceae bacterium]|nr:hypothetical protein [Desulfobulbaceae bacterium]